jgi:hypothetical protein
MERPVTHLFSHHPLPLPITMVFGFSTYFLTKDTLGPTIDAIAASGFKAI